MNLLRKMCCVHLVLSFEQAEAAQVGYRHQLGTPVTPSFSFTRTQCVSRARWSSYRASPLDAVFLNPFPLCGKLLGILPPTKHYSGGTFGSSLDKYSVKSYLGIRAGRCHSNRAEYLFIFF